MPLTEPWLSGSRGDAPAIPRAVLHALDLAREDIAQWCTGLSEEELFLRPAGLPPVAFHLRHIARSMDRLLTYAEASRLTSEQISALKSELEAPAAKAELFAELELAWADAERRILALAAAATAVPGFWEQPRAVGSRQLPTTVGGLLVHVADHTQRHVGQAVTTAKLVQASRTTSP